MIHDHPVMHVVPEANGAFALELERERGRDAALRVEPAGAGGFSVAGPRVEGAWRMVRDDGPNGGFVLLGADRADELGRSVGTGRLGDRREMRYVLLGDGTLFRVVPAGAGEGGFDVSGYETEGPYLTARREAAGFCIAPTPACGGLEDVRVLSVLLAAEILAAAERCAAHRTVRPMGDSEPA